MTAALPTAVRSCLPRFELAADEVRAHLKLRTGLDGSFGETELLVARDRLLALTRAGTYGDYQPVELATSPAPRLEGEGPRRTLILTTARGRQRRLEVGGLEARRIPELVETLARPDEPAALRRWEHEEEDEAEWEYVYDDELDDEWEYVYDADSEDDDGEWEYVYDDELEDGWEYVEDEDIEYQEVEEDSRAQPVPMPPPAARPEPVVAAPPPAPVVEAPPTADRATQEALALRKMVLGLDADGPDEVLAREELLSCAERLEHGDTEAAFFALTGAYDAFEGLYLRFRAVLVARLQAAGRTVLAAAAVPVRPGRPELARATKTSILKETRISVDHLDEVVHRAGSIYLTRKVAADPADGAAWEGLAIHLSERGELDKSEHCAAEALRVDPRRVQAAVLLAEAEARRGEGGDAIATILALEEHWPDSARIPLEAAYLCMRELGAPELAIEYAEQALDLEPDNDEVVALVERVLDATPSKPAETAYEAQLAQPSWSPPPSADPEPEPDSWADSFGETSGTSPMKSVMTIIKVAGAIIAAAILAPSVCN